MVAPIVVLVCWWLSLPTLGPLTWSLLAAPLITLPLFLALQTSNHAVKFPVMQWIGVGTVLMNVVFFSAPLRLFLDPTTVATIATTAWVVITAYAIWKAQNVQITNITLRSNRLTESRRIVQLTDLHAGSRSKAFINRMVKQTLAQNPDVVLITGDLIDSSGVDASYLSPLAQFNCPVYLCLGNHERYVDLQKAIDAIEANQVRILRSETVIDRDLQIIGIDDGENRDQVAKELTNITRDPTKYRILMYHRPDGFEDASNASIDLMLCGHTHAGQMWPLGILVKKRFPYHKGRHVHNDATLYVSQGTGTWGPSMRLGTKSEMTVIEALPD